MDPGSRYRLAGMTGRGKFNGLDAKSSSGEQTINDP